MSRRRSAGTFPEPPWSYAPSEVADWLASTAGPGSRRASRSRRRLHVKGFVGHCPTSAEGKLLRRLAEFGFAEAAGAHRFPPLFRWMAKSADAENGSATQHSPAQPAQSGRSPSRARSSTLPSGSCCSAKVPPARVREVAPAPEA